MQTRQTLIPKAHSNGQPPKTLSNIKGEAPRLPVGAPLLLGHLTVLRAKLPELLCAQGPQLGQMCLSEYISQGLLTLQSPKILQAGRRKHQRPSSHR